LAIQLAAQAERLLGWAQAWPQRTWAVEGAGGLGHLLAQQLLAAGERVPDVPPELAARVRLLATGNINKNDPNDARSVAVAAAFRAGHRRHLPRIRVRRAHPPTQPGRRCRVAAAPGSLSTLAGARSAASPATEETDAGRRDAGGKPRVWVIIRLG